MVGRNGEASVGLVSSYLGRMKPGGSEMAAVIEMKNSDRQLNDWAFRDANKVRRPGSEIPNS